MQRSDEMNDFIQPQGVLPLGQDTCELVSEVSIISIKDPFCTEDIEKLLSQQKSHLVNASSKRRIRLTKLRRWARSALAGDGREMFYVASTRKMMAVAVKTDGDGFVRGTPQALFEVGFAVEGTTLSRYAVSADGQRFLMEAEPEASSEATPLQVTVNWLAGVKR